MALIRFLPCTTPIKAKSRVNAFKKSVVVVRIKEKIAIVFSHTKLIALPKHKKKYYPKKKKNLLSELYPGALFQEVFELYNNQLLRFSISVSSLTLLAYSFFFGKNIICCYYYYYYGNQKLKLSLKLNMRRIKAHNFHCRGREIFNSKCFRYKFHKFLLAYDTRLLSFTTTALHQFFKPVST